jgi:hypothetical protein
MPTIAALVALSVLGAGPERADTVVPPQPATWLEIEAWREIGDPLDRADRMTASRRQARLPLLRRSLQLKRSEAPVRLIEPRLRTVLNSRIPHTLNEGALWGGRGVNLAVAAGVEARAGALTARIAPEVAMHSNAGFPLLRDPRADRSAYSTPWRTGAQSADLPHRFGSAPFVVVDPGESRLALTHGILSAGGSTERRWWGPGTENALLLSTNAPGIPHLFVELDSGERADGARWSVHGIAGALVESRFFDYDETNDLRSVSALAVEYHPARIPDLSFGAARAVYSPADRSAHVLRDAAQVVRRVRCGRRTPERGRPCEQMVSLFGRWAPAGSNAEVYGEWARTELPRSLGELLRAPNHSQGYTLGLGWNRELGAGLLHVGAEVSYLEESATFRARRPRPFYTSELIPQGYTHRGRSVGAAIGPGASSQRFAVDHLSDGAGAGIYLGRVRWDNVAYYETRPAFRSLEHDVSMLGGVRGHLDTRIGRVEGGLQYERRMNYHFRSLATATDPVPLDINNVTTRLSISPRIASRAR